MSEDAIRATLIQHWRELYPPEETMFVPRFVVVAEVIDRDGDDALRLMHTDGLSPWVQAGMLKAAALINDGSLSEAWESDGDEGEA